MLNLHNIISMTTLFSIKISKFLNILLMSYTRNRELCMVYFYRLKWRVASGVNLDLEGPTGGILQSLVKDSLIRW